MIKLPTYDDQYIKERFIQLRRPMFWWKMARDLAEAAETILRSHNKLKKDQEKGKRYRRMIMPSMWQTLFNPVNYEPAHLLYALAIENTIKGIIVGRDNQLILNEKLANKYLMKHNLRQLCETNNITLDSSDLVLLDKLTSVILWVGRYPTPKSGEDLMTINSVGKREYSGLSYWGTDQEDTRVLYCKLDAMLKPLLRDGVSEDITIEP